MQNLRRNFSTRPFKALIALLTTAISLPLIAQTLSLIHI